MACNAYSLLQTPAATETAQPLVTNTAVPPVPTATQVPTLAPTLPPVESLGAAGSQRLQWSAYTADLIVAAQPEDIEFVNANLVLRKDGAVLIDENMFAFLTDSLGSLAYQLQVLDNLDDDPYPELVFTDTTPGANCCDILYAIDFASDRDYQAVQGPDRRWGQGPRLITDDAQSAADFLTRNAEFGFAVGIEGAISDLAISQVIRFTNGAFIDVTDEYPAVLAADEERWRSELASGGLTSMMLHNYIATNIYQGEPDAACDLVDPAIADGTFGYSDCDEALQAVKDMLAATTP